MDDFDDIEFEGPAVAFIAVDVYDHERGFASDDRVFQGKFECVGIKDVNPMMIETVEYVDSDFTEFTKTVIPKSTCWGLFKWEEYEWEPHTTRVCYYKHMMVSGQVLLTKQPILPGTGDPGHDEDECFEIEFNDKVRPLFGQELPGEPEEE